MISIPTATTDRATEEYKELNQKTGKDFGVAYSDMMVKGHKNAIELFENASTKSADLDIRNWATTMLPTLRTHLVRSLACQKQCAKM